MDNLPLVILAASRYLQWYCSQFGSEMSQLYRINILDYCSDLRNISGVGCEEINDILFALTWFDIFLTQTGRQSVRALDDQYLSNPPNLICGQNSDLNKLDVKDIEAFRQSVLLDSGLRNYAIVTLMAYVGLKVSEVIHLEKTDIDLSNRRINVKKGDTSKARIVAIDEKAANAVSEYLAETPNESVWLFPSKDMQKPLSRIQVFRICTKYSEKFNPDNLRYFYCAYALQQGKSLNEIARQAGYLNIHGALTGTTRYGNYN